jgi:hypothetical protein
MVLASAISDFEFTPAVVVGFKCADFFLLYHYNCISKLRFAFYFIPYVTPSAANSGHDVKKQSVTFVPLPDNGCMQNEGSVPCLVPEK